MTQVTMITDPVRDDESRRIVISISGCRRVEGSPIVDGTPFGSRSVFEIAQADLAAGGLDARIDVLHAYGINVHRVVGDHPAVGRANRRLGYVQPSPGQAPAQIPARSSDRWTRFRLQHR